MTDHQRLRNALDYVKRFPNADPAYARIIAAAESTLPKTKFVDVWHVEAVWKETGVPSIGTYSSLAEAHASLPSFLEKYWSCVRVTGPHKHEVPA